MVSLPGWLLKQDRAIAFLGLSVGGLSIPPHQRMMALVRGDQAGSRMARYLLPVAITLPPILGALWIWGYHHHLYSEEIAIALVSLSDMALLLGFIGWNAYKLNLLDERWSTTHQALQQVNQQLEERVRERTLELQTVTDELEQRVAERTSELQAINDRWQLEFLLRARAMQAKQESEARFQAIFNTTYQFVGLLTPEGILLEANQAALDFGGLQRADVVNRPFWEADWWSISSEIQERLKQAIARAASGEFVRYEVDVRGKGDRVITIDFSIKPMVNEAGQVIMLIPEGRDISDRKQAEEFLKESQNKYQTLFNILPIGISITDAQGRIVETNWASEKILGVLQSAHIGKLYDAPDWRLIRPDGSPMPPEEYASVRALKENRFIYNVEKGVVRPDQEIRWISVSAAPIPLEQYGVAIAYIDITAWKHAEQAIKASEERYRAIIEDQTELICRFLPDGTTLFVNDAYCRFFGMQREELIGKTYQPIVYEADQERVAEQVRTLSVKNPMVVIENRVIARGEVRWTQWNNRLISNEQGQVIEYQSVGRDITDRKLVELELQHAKEAAEAANRSKSMFLANMSHELRTPLNVILGFTQVLRREPGLQADYLETLEIIQRSGEHLLGLINDILDLSKIEAGRVSLEKVQVDMLALVRSLRDMLFHRAVTKGLQFQVDVDPHVPHYILIDAQKLRQILLNLLSNAIKFTDQGRVSLRVWVAEDIPQNTASARPYLCFDVEDTGMGIAPEDMGRIFDAFMQGSSERMPEGTGLGLTITLSFVNLMGGQLSADSTVGQGSVFHLRLPLEGVQEPDLMLPEAVQPCMRLVPGQAPQRVLVVDDQPDNRRLLVRFMTQLQFDVREATNGLEAIEQARVWHPHLILMDIRMPLMDGFEATRRMRSELASDSTVIIALTASASTEDRSMALVSGCNDYVMKPFKEEELLQKIATHLGLRLEPVAQSSTSLGLATPLLLTPDVLHDLPPQWVKALHQAALNCDDEVAEQLIQQLAPAHGAIASLLHHLVQHYQFPQILQWIQACVDVSNPVKPE